jgi:hypothetical protein
MRIKTNKDWQDRWTSRVDCRQTKYFYPNLDPKKAKELITHSRPVVGRTIRWLIGHAFLKRHNAVIMQNTIHYPQGDINCRLCAEEEAETPHHIICACPALCAERAEFLLGHQLVDVPEWEINGLIAFTSMQDLILLESD